MGLFDSSIGEHMLSSSKERTLIRIARGFRASLPNFPPPGSPLTHVVQVIGTIFACYLVSTAPQNLLVEEADPPPRAADWNYMCVLASFLLASSSCEQALTPSLLAATQAFSYYTVYPQDRRLYFWLVTGILLIDVFHTAISWQAVLL